MGYTARECVSITDMLSITDLFAEGLAMLEPAGTGNVRVIYYITRIDHGECIRMPVVSIVMPIDAFEQSRALVASFFSFGAPLPDMRH